MKVDKPKIWIKSFFKSFIWLVIPLSLFGTIKSCSIYREAGEHLTPASVSVSGHWRGGYYVSPYHRRPPGAVKHDAPYERKRRYMISLFIVSVIGGVVSTIFYPLMSINEIKRQQKTIKEIERKRHEENRNKHTSLILNNLDFNFSQLQVIPIDLKVRTAITKYERAKCKFCNSAITSELFHVSFVATTKRHYVCLECLSGFESKKLGRSQPKTTYKQEFEYALNYYKTLDRFILEFREEINTCVFTYSDAELKTIFEAEVLKPSPKPKRH